MVLNSHNEWSPLKEIIVGTAANYTSHDRELSFDLFFHENLFRSDWASPRLGNAGRSSTDARSWGIEQPYVAQTDGDVQGPPTRRRPRPAAARGTGPGLAGASSHGLGDRRRQGSIGVAGEDQDVADVGFAVNGRMPFWRSRDIAEFGDDTALHCAS